jgi:hypothetical protein
VELFGANNTFEGGVTLSGDGAVGIFSANGLGTGTLRTETTGGTLIVGADMSSGSGIANDIDLPIGNLTVTGSNAVLSGQISGSGTLTKAGGNTLTLTKDSSSFGGLSVNEGTLIVSGTGMTVGAANFSGGTTVDLTNPLTVNTSANIAGLGLSSDTAFILGGSDVVNPTIGNHRTLTVQGGAMTISGTPIDLSTTNIVVAGTEDTALSLSEAATLGNLTLKSGSLSASNNIEMAADFIYRWELDSTAHSVAVDGDLSLAGAWTLQLAGGGTPDPGVKYDLFTYTGAFTGTLNPTIEKDGVTWLTPSITKDDDKKKICMMFGLLGDANGDLVVDAADYIAMKQNFGMTGAEWKDGDFDYDTDVDWDDLQILMANFGTRILPVAPAIPEPGSVMLLMFGAAALLRRRKA